MKSGFVALAVAALGRLIGFDGDRSFYPSACGVIVSYSRALTGEARALSRVR